MMASGKKLFRLFKTASTYIGAVSFKNGKTLLVLEDVARRLNLNKEIKITLMVIASGSVLYTLAFTRLPSFDIGTFSFSAISFFLTREALLSIPYVQDLSSSAITALSLGSAFSAFFSEIFSKNLDLHRLIDHEGVDFIRDLRSIESKWIFSHAFMGVLFSVAMGVGYYTGCLNLSEDIGISELFSDFSWSLIILNCLFAISGSALEFAFSVKPMFESIRPPQQTVNNQASLLTHDEMLINSENVDTLEKPYSSFVDNYKHIGIFASQVSTPKREQCDAPKKKFLSCAIL